MFTKKIMAAAAVAVASLGLAATSAHAASSHPVGTAVTGTTDPAGADSYTIDMVGFISCESQLAGTITNVYGAGLGVRGSITSGSFNNCNTGGAVGNFSSPWIMNVVPTTSTLNDVTVSNVNVTVTLFGVPCNYTGTLNGEANESNDTITLSNAGGLNGAAGNSFLCPGNPDVDGVYVLSPTTLNIS